MNLQELSGWLGKFEISINKPDGSKEIFVLKNRITNTALNMVRDAWKGEVSDLEIKYLALGDDGGAIDDNMTELGNELFRTGWISTVTPGFGQLQNTAFILDDEAVFHIREIGIFGGAGASLDPNTGTLISRVLWDRNKTALESIQIVRTDIMVRG